MKSGFESREKLQFDRADSSEFQVRGAAALNDRLANDVRRNGTHSSGTDDDRVGRHHVFGLLPFARCWRLFDDKSGNPAAPITDRLRAPLANAAATVALRPRPKRVLPPTRRRISVNLSVGTDRHRPRLQRQLAI